MSPVTTAHRIYFAAVGFLALRVGFVGYFHPAEIHRVIPWGVPPLHARFLGAMYLSGLVFMIGSLLARRWSEVRVVVPMIAIWTGMLLVVSLLHPDAFDYSRPQVWIWFAAYAVYPAIAAGLAWRHRADTGHPKESAPLPAWASAYLVAQGVLLTSFALALLVVPEAMVPAWPWKTTPLLLQIYASPFLSYGIGSLILARQNVWAEVRNGVVSIFVFAVLVFVASLMHRKLFSLAENPDRVWFAAFGVAIVMLAALSARAIASSSAGPAPARAAD